MGDQQSGGLRYKLCYQKAANQTMTLAVVLPLGRGQSMALTTLILAACLPVITTAYQVQPFRSLHHRRPFLTILLSSTKSFDEKAFEEDRISKDAQAMDQMKKVATEEFEKLRTPWKWRIRKSVWGEFSSYHMNILWFSILLATFN